MDASQPFGIMSRSRWITIVALAFFALVTIQLVLFSWRKSQTRQNTWKEPIDTPEAKAERRRKDAITKLEVEKMLQKAMADRGKKQTTPGRK